MKLLDKIRLAVFDFDGTLVKTGFPLRRDTIDFLKRLKYEGKTVIIATGRSLHTIRKHADQIDPGMHLILMNGAWIHDLSSARDVRALNLDRDSAGRAIELLRGWGFDIILQKGIPDSHLFFYESLNEDNTEFSGRIERNYNRCERVSDLRMLLDDDPSILTVLDTTDRVLHCKEMLEQEQLGVRLIYSVSAFNKGFSWLEILHRDATKGRALGLLAGELNVPQSQVMAVGDNHNDIDMLEWAGYGIAVGNAEECVKSVADYILPDNGAGVVNIGEI